MDTTLIIPIISGASFIGAITIMVYMLWCSVRMRDSWLYQHFHPRLDGGLPPVEIGVKTLPAVMVTTSHGQDTAANMLDREASTRWTSGASMKPEMWVRFNLGQVCMMDGVTFSQGTSTKDTPAAWSVAVATTLPNWQTVATGNGNVTATWPATDAQYVKVTCESQNDYYWWSVHEAYLSYREKVVVPPPVVPPTPPTPPVVPPANITEKEAVEQVKVWANNWGWYYYGTTWFRDGDTGPAYEGWSCYRLVGDALSDDNDLARIQQALRTLPVDKETRGLHLATIVDWTLLYRTKVLNT